MKIWIDGYEANVLQRLGSSQVAFELIKNLEKIDKENDYTVLLPNKPLEDLPSKRLHFSYKVLRPSKAWTRVALPLALYSAKEKPDLIFSPTHYISRFSPVSRIVTIFDLSYLHFPEMFKKEDLWKLTNWTKFSIENAEHIITISEFSKKDIIKNYNVDQNKISVAYPGYNLKAAIDKNENKLKELKKKFKIDQSYIIYIGTLQPRKNLLRLIEAFKEIDGLKLVIVGKSAGEGREGWMYKDILESPKKLGIEEKVIFTNYLSEEDLNILLNGALAYIQPSLWEGFGIPAVDAMSCGVPVLVSNVSSLPEIVGEAGLTFDPYSLEDIRAKIKRIKENKILRDRLSQSGIKRAKEFSWEKMANQVLEVFKNYG